MRSRTSARGLLLGAAAVATPVIAPLPAVSATPATPAPAPASPPAHLYDNATEAGGDGVARIFDTNPLDGESRYGVSGGHRT
jgi:hypothetical protein